MSSDVADVEPQTIDTTAHAAEPPDVPQPYAELGLADDEYQRIREILARRPDAPAICAPDAELGLADGDAPRIREILGRGPTGAEPAMYSVEWSEDCSYKSSKAHLRYFGETTTPEMREKMLAGIGENAGVVDV